jgi:hypothetical protein
LAGIGNPCSSTGRIGAGMDRVSWVKFANSSIRTGKAHAKSAGETTRRFSTGIEESISPERNPTSDRHFKQAGFVALQRQK